MLLKDKVVIVSGIGPGLGVKLALPARILHRVPASLSFERAAMIEPVAIAVHAVRRLSLQPTDTAVVVGSGMIGLLVIQALRWAGVRRVMAIDRVIARLQLARELGADETFGADPGANPADEVLRATNGRGADAVFEVVGHNATVQLAIAITRRGGGMVLVGNLSPNVEFPLQQVVTRELSVFGSCASAGEYPTCLDLIDRGVIRVDPLITAVAPLHEGVEWFERLSAPGGGGHMKVILQP